MQFPKIPARYMGKVSLSEVNFQIWRVIKVRELLNYKKKSIWELILFPTDFLLSRDTQP